MNNLGKTAVLLAVLVTVLGCVTTASEWSDADTTDPVDNVTGSEDSGDAPQIT